MPLPLTMDLDIVALLRGSLRQALLSPAQRPVGSLLDELGWDEVLKEDEATGVRLLFEEHGRALTNSSMLDRVMLRAGDDRLRGCTRILHPLPAAQLMDVPVGDGQSTGFALEEWNPDDRIALFDWVDGECAVLTVEARALAPGRTVQGLDGELGWILHNVPATAVTVVAAGDAARLLWEPLRAAALRALASELIGVSRAALDLAVEHVKVRTQFGKPIGAFQAVRHRLAEAYAHTAGADAMIEAAWIRQDSWSAESAKAAAGQAHANVTRHAMQVCGALGLTGEHPLHRYVRRGFVIDALMGSHTTLIDTSGLRLLEEQQAPRICRF